VSTSTQATAERLVTLAGGEGLLAEPWFQSAADRAQHADELDAVVGEWIGARSCDEVIKACEEVGAPASRVYSAAEIVDDEQYQALGTIAEVPDPVLGTVRMPNVQFRLSRTPGRIRWIGPAMGSSNDEVFERLGVSETELEELRSQGVV
jgi:formyl-CoA transferase